MTCMWVWHSVFIMVDYEENVCRHYRHMQSNHSTVLTEVFPPSQSIWHVITKNTQQAKAEVHKSGMTVATISIMLALTSQRFKLNRLHLKWTLIASTVCWQSVAPPQRLANLYPGSSFVLRAPFTLSATTPLLFTWQALMSALLMF